MKNQILELTKKLIALNTADWEKQNIAKAYAIVAQELQWYESTSYESKSVPSILYYNKKAAKNHYDLVFNCHLDIIPANLSQFEPQEKDWKLYWAWAMDMKANLVCALYAFKKYAKESDKNIAIQFVSDEETGWYCGTKYQVESWLSSDFVIATEPTNFDIVHKAKWVYQFELSCEWTTAHSAYPWNWVNAIEKMLDFLIAFKAEFQNPDSNTWQTTYNIAEIHSSNFGYNKIPNKASVKIDIRYSELNIQEIQEKVWAIVPSDFLVREYATEPIFYTEPDHENIKKLQSLVWKCSNKKSKVYWANGTSDGRHYWKNAIEFWPIGWWIWTDEEWVDIKSLEQYYHILKNFVIEL